MFYGQAMEHIKAAKQTLKRLAPAETVKTCDGHAVHVTTTEALAYMLQGASDEWGRWQLYYEAEPNITLGQETLALVGLIANASPLYDDK